MIVIPRLLLCPISLIADLIVTMHATVHAYGLVAIIVCLVTYWECGVVFLVRRSLTESENEGLDAGVSEKGFLVANGKERMASN